MNLFGKPLTYELAVCPECLEQVFSNNEGAYEPCNAGHDSVGVVWIEMSVLRPAAKAYVRSALTRREEAIAHAAREVERAADA